MTGRAARLELYFLCVAVLTMWLVILIASFWTFNGNSTVFGQPLGADFAGFYSAGRLLNENPPQRLYDFPLQDQLYHEVLPGLQQEYILPYVYPPFFTLVFRPLALLPYPWAYLVWLLLSIGLVLLGLFVMARTLTGIPGSDWPTIFLLTLSFEPLVMECWLGGQTSAIGFCAMAFALRLYHLRRFGSCGLALACCLYKPPLLLLILPMLAVGRQWRVLGVFAVGAIVLALLSLITVGFQGMVGYFDLVKAFSRLSSSNMPGFPIWKFVDLNSFFKALLGDRFLPSWVLLLVCAIPCLFVLVRMWARLDQLNEEQRKLVWASTLSWTLVFNLYVGVYDTILVILGFWLTADVLFTRKRDPAQALTPVFHSFLVALYIVPWVAQPLARSIGFQPLTLVLAALGAYQLALARQKKP
jgi:hypothetical protein